jgi:hypothetical protein
MEDPRAAFSAAYFLGFGGERGRLIMNRAPCQMSTLLIGVMVRAISTASSSLAQQNTAGSSEICPFGDTRKTL